MNTIDKLQSMDAGFQALIGSAPAASPNKLGEAAITLGVSMAVIGGGANAASAHEAPRAQVIEAGDTFSGIMATHGMTSEQGLYANPGIVNADMIYAGDSLKVCSPDQALAIPGDTASELAAEHSMSLDNFVSLNGMQDPDYLEAGKCYEVGEAGPKDTSNPQAIVVMRSGDTLYELAQDVVRANPKAGSVQSVVSTLAEDNGITDVSRIPTGKPVVVRHVDHETLVASQNASQPLVIPLEPGQPIVVTEAPVLTQPESTKVSEIMPQPTEKPSENLNLKAISIYNGVDADITREVVKYMVDEQDLTPLGAAYLTANFIQETSLNPSVLGDNGTAAGIGQWRFERQEGMPVDDLFGQVDFALNIEMLRDGRAADLPDLLRDPSATSAQIQDALRRWERWGHAGKRFEWAEDIYTVITSQSATSPAPAPAPAPQPVVTPTAKSVPDDRSFVFPVATTQDAVINDPLSRQADLAGWCYKSADSCHHDYNAADIAVETGTPVVAPVDGTVVRAADHDDSVAGSRVSIKGADGNLYYLAHMGEGTIQVEAGQTVSAGDQVGAVGTNDDAFGTTRHVHLDILPGQFDNRPTCSGSGCSDLPFINPQPQLIDAFQALPEK